MLKGGLCFGRAPPDMLLVVSRTNCLTIGNLSTQAGHAEETRNEPIRENVVAKQR